MGAWSTGPWDNDTAADWFGNMMEKTGLATYVEETLRRPIDEDEPWVAEEIRAAASVLVLMGHIFVWPGDDWERHLNLAIARLEEMLASDYGVSSHEQIRAEIALLRSRLENRGKYPGENLKWWHFDE
ncbi:MAG TPA: DUF4259 domain-containing protein [Anaerolineales bacterium]